MAFGIALVSGTPYTVAAMHPPPKALVTSMALEVHAASRQSDERPKIVSTFKIIAANTLESVTVRYVDGELDPASKQQIDHLMRCLRTDSAKPIDPRLIDTLRDIAREVDAPLWLISGYRAPEHPNDHNFHNRAQAADIRVENVPAYKLRDLAKKLHVRGIGYYPTTNMIHVDVRDEDYFWTDWSGPHQTPHEIRTR